MLGAAVILAAIVGAVALVLVVRTRRARRRQRDRLAQLEALEQVVEQLREQLAVEAAADLPPAVAALQVAEREARANVDFLVRASAVLGATQNVDQVASAVQELAVPALADTCRLVLAGEPTLTAGADRANAYRIPLRGQESVIGELCVWREDRAISPPEAVTAELLADRTAQALDQTMRLTEQVKTSSTLEHSLLPAAVLPIDHLQVATRYLAAAEGQSVGGDFYDVLRTPAGAAVLIIGDVQGKGIEAATLTSTARHTLRAAALEGASPAAMLQQLNDALLYGSAERQLASPGPTGRFVTVSVVCLTPDEAGFRAVVANGGHPPPIAIRPDGTVDQLVAEGPLLGVFDEPFFQENTVHLALADVLVLYTDGVTEQRRQTDLFDEAQLGRLVRNMLTVQKAEDIAQIILDTVVVLNPREVRDDIALVVARVTGPR